MPRANHLCSSRLARDSRYLCARSLNSVCSLRLSFQAVRGRRFGIVRRLQAYPLGMTVLAIGTHA